MEVLRTPDERFNGLKEYPFEPHYTNIKTHDGTTLRIHHIDEGPKDGPMLLAMHGQPVWSYLYARMIPFLVKAGIRVIAPDYQAMANQTNQLPEKITAIKIK